MFALHFAGLGRAQAACSRTALAVDHHRQHHLLQIGAIILGVAHIGLNSARLLRRKTNGCIHEHQGQIREQVAAEIEQLFLDQILHGPWIQASFGLFFDLLAQSGHRPVKVMQLKALDAADRCTTLTNTPRSTANSKPRIFSRSPRTSAIPGRSHRRLNNSGPRRCIALSTPVSMSFKIGLRSQCRPSDSTSRSCSPLASG